MRIHFIKIWVAIFIGISAATALSIAYIDRPAARYAHDVIGRHAFLLEMTRIPEYIGTASAILAVVLGIVSIARGSLTGPARVLLLTAISFIVGQAIKDQLKFDFGRLWPETWVNHNPSFIDTGDYGFFPFHGGAGWGSFPSGHTTAITSAMAVLWIAWPRLRALWFALAAAVLIGLYGMDYHFIGDMIAGSFLGTAVGSGVAHIGGLTRAREA